MKVRIMSGEKIILVACFLAISLAFGLFRHLGGVIRPFAGRIDASLTLGLLAAASYFTVTALGAVFSVGLGLLAGLFAYEKGKWQDVSFLLDFAKRGSWIFAGLSFTIALMWWQSAKDLEFFVPSMVFLSTALGIWGALKVTDNIDLPTNADTSMRVVIFGFFLLCVFLRCFDSQDTGIADYGHNMTALIGPAQLLAAGVVPFDGLPIQYGLGPSMLIASGCATNCYWSTWIWGGITSFAMLTSMGVMVVALLRHKSVVMLAFTLTALFIISLFFTGWAPNPVNIAAVPQVYGLRFMPGVIFMVGLYLHYIYNVKFLQGYRENIFHFGWLLCFCWSPEAAIHATFIWGTVYVLNVNRFTLREFSKRSAKMALILAGFVLAIKILYVVIWDLNFSLTTYLAYILYAPGQMDFNPSIARLPIFVLCLAALAGLLQTQDEKMKPWIIPLMLALGTSTYFLGRSHPNNVLNVLAYWGLFLATLYAHAGSARISMTARAILIACVALAVSLPPQRQAIYASIAEAELAFYPQTFFTDTKLQSGPLASRVEEVTGKADPQFAIDLQTIVGQIRGSYDEAIEFHLTYPDVIDASDPYPPWNALHAHINWAFMPYHIADKAVADVKNQLNTGGWYVYHADDPDWRTSTNRFTYEAYYNLSSSLTVGKFIANRYVPK